MTQTFCTLLLIFLFSSLSQAQLDESKKAVADATQEPVKINTAEDHSLVSVLGYHDFSSTKQATEMCLPTDTFRSQMQALKDLELKVISLGEFLAWKNGTLKLPERSVLITIDDGWKSVYHEAYPVLKEFGYPFTLFLYQDFVGPKKLALNEALIKEMMENGASIGSHSVSHPYPSTIKKYIEQGGDAYHDFLTTEFTQSKAYLDKTFKIDITTYAYPGGFHTPEMFEVATTAGYDLLFTVIPGKVSKKSSNLTLPRYIILGTHDSIFENATSFPATATSAASLGAKIQSTPYPVTPPAGATIDERLPEISIDLSTVEQLDPESVVMRVSGFGKVPHTYQPESKKFSWKVNRRLRKPTCDITVSWKLLDAESYEKPMSWTFVLNRQAAYLPTTAPSLPEPKTQFELPNSSN
ncbi:polysaccharide deacetylase family protein [Rubritalea spongiae]|uniref:Polysaccharide deacetylase family protein n=1 Tax=Rubritalea spongiae TaxID=430797 RepID=A0ABW5E383_9BACT